MKEQKLSRAVKCLYAMVLVQILSTAYLAFSSIRALGVLDEIDQVNRQNGVAASHSYSLWGFMGGSSIFALIAIVGAFYVVQDLKRGKGWAWVGGLTLFLMTAPSWSFPASVIGIISLLDVDVRGEFIDQLDVKI